mmetsp:Transcript_21353/g.62245  ORF Transcript_21353/g.62245 Transcript_21353/m.62245 type:complete len:81 (-) Transcript_21353:2896-3138(-)
MEREPHMGLISQRDSLDNLAPLLNSCWLEKLMTLSVVSERIASCRVAWNQGMVNDICRKYVRYSVISSRFVQGRNILCRL